MNAQSIVLSLEVEDGRTAFEPGARVRGVAGWAAPVAPPGLELRLVWATRGPGGRDFTIVETIPFGSPLRAERRPFALVLPDAPYTFRGVLISLTWTLELVALPGEEKAVLKLTVGPGGQGIDLGSAGAPG